MQLLPRVRSRTAPEQKKRGRLPIPVPKITLVMIRTVSMLLSQLVMSSRQHGRWRAVESGTKQREGG